MVATRRNTPVLLYCVVKFDQQDWNLCCRQARRSQRRQAGKYYTVIRANERVDIYFGLMVEEDDDNYVL